jgi:hypothetical protein
LDAQAQSAIALHRSSGNWYPTWSGAGPAYWNQVQAFASQLLGTSTPGNTQIPIPAMGGGTTDINPSVPVQPTTGIDTTTGGQTTVGSSSNIPPPTGMNLSFGGSIQHIIFQFLLVLVGLALLLGGIYLLGSRK